MKKMTREWVKKAEADYRAAGQLSGKVAFNDQVCFHCQQAAEKYLKALLEGAALSVPKTHDCVKLMRLLPPECAIIHRFRRGLTMLNRFAVTARYPGHDAT